MLRTKALKKLLQERGRRMEKENKRKRERKINKVPKPSLTNFGKFSFNFLYLWLKSIEIWNVVSLKYLGVKVFLNMRPKLYFVIWLNKVL